VVIVIATVEAQAGSEVAPRGAVIIAVGTAATWAAHILSDLIGHRLRTELVTTPADILHAARGSFPIMLAALPAVLCMVGAGLELWPLDAAITASNTLAVAALGAAGLVAARATHLGWARSIAWGTLTASIGMVIVWVEILVLH
jgi:hypothetical protein